MMGQWRPPTREGGDDITEARSRLWARALIFFVMVDCFILRPVVHAQHPLCPAPTRDDVYYVYCSLDAPSFVESFLYDFSVSQLFKSPGGFELPTATIIQALGFGRLLFAKDEDREQMLTERPSVEFRPFDRLGDDLAGKGYSSSGEFISKGRSGAQTLRTVDPLTRARVEVELPEIVQGMYWRSPAHLEMQFYAGHAPRFTLPESGGGEYQETVRCASISRSGARATTTDPSHRQLLSQFGGCE